MLSGQEPASETNDDAAKPDEATPLTDPTQTDDGDITDIFDEQLIAESMMTFWQVFRTVIAVAAPLAGGSTFQIQLFILGLVLVRLSENETMLASTAHILKMVGFLVISLSPIFPTAIMLRNQLGELHKLDETDPENNHEEQCDRIAASAKGMLIVSTTTSPISICSLYFSRALLVSIFRQEDDVALLAQDVLRMYSISVPGHITRTTATEILNGFNKITPNMIIGLSSLSLTTLVGVFLSYGLFGNTPMGRDGVVIGSIIEPYLTTLILMIYIRRHRDFSRFHFLSSRNHQYIWAQIKSILTLGIPTFIAATGDMLAGMALNALIGITGGKEALAATSILNQLGTLTNLTRPTLAQAVSYEISYRSGKHEYRAAANFAIQGTKAAALLTIPIPLLISTAPDLLVLISGQPVSSMTFIRELAPLVGWTQAMEGLKVNFLHQLHAVNDNFIPAVIGTSGVVGGVVIGAVTGIYSNGKVFALTGANAAFITAATAGLFIRWYLAMKPEKIQLQQLAREAVYNKPGALTLFNKCCGRLKRGEQHALPNTPSLN